MMIRLFGVDITVPKTTSTPIAGPAVDHQSNAMVLWTSSIKVKPISSYSSSSSSRKRKRKVSEGSLVPYASSSSSAPTSALTMLSEERTNGKTGKKARKAMPSKEERAMANSKKPDLSPLLRTMVMEKLGISNYNPKKIIQKYVYESDIKEDQARLSIPVTELIGKEEDFLNKTELGMLSTIDVAAIKVKVMYYERTEEGDGGLKAKDMTLTRWPKPNMPMPEEKKTSVRYVVRCGWNEVVKAIGLKAGDSIQVWASRYSHPPHPPHPPHPHDLDDDNLALVVVNLGNSRKLAGKSTDE